MAAFIHGFRRFNFVNCATSGIPVLAGMMNMHVHSKVQKSAECKGISGAMWMTDAAKLLLAEVDRANGPKVPHDADLAPAYDCTCGHYFYRTFKDVWSTASNVYAHVTCLERTVLHVNGGRTTQYSIDYLLTPPIAGSNVFLGLQKEDEAVGKVIKSPVSLGGGYNFAVLAEERPYEEVLQEVSLSLGVPIIDKNSLLGCPVCLEVNGWREPSEISERMKREWFGVGYQPRPPLDRKRFLDG